MRGHLPREGHALELEIRFQLLLRLVENLQRLGVEGVEMWLKSWGLRNLKSGHVQGARFRPQASSGLEEHVLGADLVPRDEGLGLARLRPDAQTVGVLRHFPHHVLQTLVWSVGMRV